MQALKPWFSNKVSLTFLVLFLTIFIFRWMLGTNFLEVLKPQNVYSLSLNIQYEQGNKPVSIQTFLPDISERQNIIEEKVISSDLDYQVQSYGIGRIGVWSRESDNISDNQLKRLKYQALLVIKDKNYKIDNNLTIEKNYPESFKQYLKETPEIQVNHKEIKALWEEIKPAESNLVLPVIQSIYDYTYKELEGAPFKGLTDALTALRLKQASCNGKSRLFVALARLNKIPARLVGGIILNSGSKKTSHQWVEVYVDGHWIPFGPTNGNFAHLPENYLALYLTDQALFRHTSDINFDYRFTIDKQLVASSHFGNNSFISDSPENTDENIFTTDLDGSATDNINKAAHQGGLWGRTANVTQLLLDMGLESKTISLFLLFPLCTLVIAFLRNIAGIKTFGIFMPMLIAAACVFTGFLQGIIAFVIILFSSFLCYVALNNTQLLKIPRLAAVITLNTIFFILGLSLIGNTNHIEFGMLSLFPVVIISFIAEKVHQLSEENNFTELVLVSLGTLLSIWLCYLVLKSFLLEAIFSYFPEFYLLVLAALIYIGQWTGLRLSELFRFSSLISQSEHPVLGINARNRELVYPLNEKALLKLAADKNETKVLLKKFNIPVPESLLVLKNISAIDQLEGFLKNVTSFALKPNFGAQGNGIVIVVDKQGDEFIKANGKKLSIKDLEDHCIEIISGRFSQVGDNDIAYFEPLIKQHESLQKIGPFGLSDIRVILVKGKVISAMLRMPTSESDGKANLHQGAIGIAIDIETGLTTNAKIKKQNIEFHPDTNEPLIGVKLPYWNEIIDMSVGCFDAIKLGYLGVDICLDETQGPLVLEVNGRPGIEIQNVQERGFKNEALS